MKHAVGPVVFSKILGVDSMSYSTRQEMRVTGPQK